MEDPMADTRSTAKRRTTSTAANKPLTLINAAIVLCIGALILSLWTMFTSPETPSSGPNTLLDGLSVGPEHGCVIRHELDESNLVTNGVRGIWCWGRNDNGELGDGKGGSTAYAPDAAATSLTAGAVRVLGIDNARSVNVVGADRTCAVTQDDELWCWGVSRSIGMPRDAWEKSGVAAAGSTGRANRLVPELVMRGVVSLAVYSVDRPAAGVEDLDRYACVVTVDGDGHGISCWGAGQGELGADGSRGLAIDPQPVSGLPVRAGVISLVLRADRACAVFDLLDEERPGTWCWEHRTAVAAQIDEATPYIVETTQGGREYRNDLRAANGLTVVDRFLSDDGQPYCRLADGVSPDGQTRGNSSISCRGYRELPYDVALFFWLDTGEYINRIVSSAPETRWFGTAAYNEGEGGAEFPEGVRHWIDGVAASGGFVCAPYEPEDTRSDYTELYCFERVGAPTGWPALAWRDRAITFPAITGESATVITPRVDEFKIAVGAPADYGKGTPSRSVGSGCAILSGQWLFCFGENSFGQLGTGSTDDRPDGHFVHFNLEAD